MEALFTYVYLYISRFDFFSSKKRLELATSEDVDDRQPTCEWSGLPPERGGKESKVYFCTFEDPPIAFLGVINDSLTLLLGQVNLFSRRHQEGKKRDLSLRNGALCLRYRYYSTWHLGNSVSEGAVVKVGALISGRGMGLLVRYQGDVTKNEQSRLASPPPRDCSFFITLPWLLWLPTGYPTLGGYRPLVPFLRSLDLGRVVPAGTLKCTTSSTHAPPYAPDTWAEGS
ncbi:hypothetical protein F5Y07DRAFT_283807 [Xylaria sp. FL0933]|nr:hypothetical protein F5Y07DRAFT_283807 [Xylaria sp. FL0933]